MATEAKIYITVVEVISGDIDYSNAKRLEIQVDTTGSLSDLALVRRIKRAIGWTGERCHVETDDISAGAWMISKPGHLAIARYHVYGSAS